MDISTQYLSRSVGLLNPVDPVTAEVSSTLGDVLLKMKHGTGAVLLVDQHGTLEGIFTERDYLKKCAPGTMSSEDLIEKYMTPDPQTIDMQTPFAYALKLMTEGGYRHVPIVDEQNFPVGIVSMRDIVAEIVKSFVLPQT